MYLFPALFATEEGWGVGRERGEGGGEINARDIQDLAHRKYPEDETPAAHIVKTLHIYIYNVYTYRHCIIYLYLSGKGG